MKIPTLWNVNEDYPENEYPYDSILDTYDSSTMTYDGIVVDESPVTTKLPALWSNNNAQFLAIQDEMGVFILDEMGRYIEDEMPYVSLLANPTTWSHNPLYPVNEYSYNSPTIPYDSALFTYDGVTAGESPVTENPKTAWVNV